jgi:hypothetical protein
MAWVVLGLMISIDLGLSPAAVGAAIVADD